MKKCEYKIVGLDCADCANKIQKELSKSNKLKNVSVSFAKQKLSYETDTITKEEIEKMVKAVEPETELIDYASLDIKNELRQKQNNKKFILHVLRLVAGFLTAMIGIGLQKLGYVEIATVLIVLGYAVLLYRTIKNAVKLLFQSRTINENLLITVSCIGAYFVGKQTEGIMVITLYEIGKILEEKAVNKTRKSISDLMDIKPEYANLKKGNKISKVSPSEVNVGDIVIVKQGEKVPLDSIVIKGSASLNTASLTGEAKPQYVTENENVLSGSIVLEGMLEIKVTRNYENSTVSRILELVENATDKKAKTETFVNKAAKIYTPIVLVMALLLAIFLPVVSNITYFSENGSIYRALIFLVISCPCAIAISVPLCYFSGIGRSSREGILIKGSDYLDGLKDVKEVIFDKTGTLTTGEFAIEKIETYNEEFSQNKVLEYAALGEKYSNHPIAKSIVESYENNEETKVDEYEEIAGKGIKYKIDGNYVLVGNCDLVGKSAETVDSTKVYVKFNENIIGAICLTDKVKPGAKEAIAGLKKRNIVTKIFTGDNKEAATKVAKELEVEDVKFGMLPNDKYTELEKELDKYKNTKYKVAFVGDGINDSPVLARSDIGVSMGGMGAESSIEASDVVIMTDKLDKINTAIDISKKTNEIIKQNLCFSIVVKLLVLVLSAFGVATMWEAVFADVGATLITVVNSIRIGKK